MSVYIQKFQDGTYSLFAVGLIDIFSLHCLSELSEKDFGYMIEYMEQMRVSNHLPFYYIFPRYKRSMEIDVKLVRSSAKEYQLILNLGVRILSNMNQNEFDQTLHELKDLVSQSDHSKVYFPPVKAVEEKQNRIVQFLLANQILEKQMQTILYQMSQFNDAALALMNRTPEFIASNMEIIDANFLAASKIVVENK
jgi:hypothetical protein